MFVALLASVFIISYLFYQNYNLKKQNISLEKSLSERILKLNDVTKLLTSLRGDYIKVRNEKIKLKNNLNNEIAKITSLQQKVSSMTGTVGTLEKLSKTDKELLQKYSKVFFLNENYIPNKLNQIDKKYIYDKNMDKWIYAPVLSYLKKMIDDASSEGINLLVKSAYRSFETQTQLKNRYSVNYGSGSNTFSADQGYSEHQLGTTIDFTTLKIGDRFSLFENSDSYEWLKKNAYKYGFVLSYPKGNKYYIFEPWHWRFVGVSLATKLHNDEMYFYDLTQREIDKYLVSMFD